MRRFHMKKNVAPDLEISKPYFGVKDGEREDVVDERFSSPSLWRHAEYLLRSHEKLHDLRPRTRATAKKHSHA